MSSLKMTFSLTSLILIFALSFAAMPVMAAPDGATVSIAAYTGKVADTSATAAPVEADATGAVDYVATRGNFIVTVTLSKPATLATEHVIVRKSAGVNEVATAITGSTVAAFPGSTDSKKYTVQIDMADTAYEMSRLVVSIAADAFMDLTAEPKGNQASTGGIFTSLPKHNDWTYTPALDSTDEPDITSDKFDKGSTFNVKFTLSGGTVAFPAANDIQAQVQIKDADGDDVPAAELTAASAGLVGTTFTTTVTITGADGDTATLATPIHIGINPNWAAGSTLRIPAETAPGPTTVDPTVDISLVGDIDETAKTFEVRFTFAQATAGTGETAGPIPNMLTPANISITKEDPDSTTDPKEMIASDAYVQASDIIGPIGDGTFLATVNYRLDALPLYVGTGIGVSETTISGMDLAADAKPLLKVGDDGTDPVDPVDPVDPAAPGKPDAPMAATNATDDLIIDVSWMEPTDTGDTAITGYVLTKYDSDGMVVKTFPETPAADMLLPATSTTYEVGPVPAADRGMSFTFTVTAWNGAGAGTKSDKSAAYMVPEEAMEPDTTAPIVMITAPTELTNGKAVFTISFDEMLGTGPSGFQFSDLEITGGTAMETDLNETADSTDDMPKYTLSVTPGDGIVTVSLRENSASDTAGNTVDHTTDDASAMYNNDSTPPTVVITPPTAPDSNGNLTFTFDFSEDVNFDDNDIDRAGSDNVRLGANSAPVQDATDSTVYTVLVEPKDPAVDTTVLLLKGSVTDMAGNGLAADADATYNVPGADPGVPDPTIAGPTMLSCLRGGTISITFDEGLKAGEALAVGDIEITGAGWEIKNFANARFSLMPKSDRSWIGTTEVTVKVKKDVVVDADDKGNTEAMKKFTVGPVLEIPKNSYIVVVRYEARNRTHLRHVPTLYVGDPHVGSPDVSVQTWECMPDLGVLLGRNNHTYADNRGGTLVVEGGGGLIVKQSAAHVKDANVAGSETIGAGTVGITEIMWAIDRSEYFGQTRNFQHAQEQWIELHNLNNFDVKVTLFDLVRDEAYSNNSYGEIDRMTNYNLPQYHGSWPIRDVGDNKDGRGQDGDSDYGEDFIAMQRGPATLVDNKHYLHGDFDGRSGGKWTRATAVYLTRSANFRLTGQLPIENLNYDFIGTPGRSNAIGPTAPAGVTGVPLKPFVINEVGNRNNRLYDWIEIRNTSDAEANLRNYNISLVTGIDADISLFNFPNSDIKIGKGEVLLVLASDPEDDGEHPIAVGFDVLGGSDQVLGIGENNPDSEIKPAKYIVAKSDEVLYTEGLPSSNFMLILRHGEGVNPADAATYNGSYDKANSAKAKVGTHERIVDVAGYHNSLGDRNVSPKYTALWPLNGQGPPFSKNDLKEEGVYFRRDPNRIHGENNNDKPAFVSQGYTGVGYRRHASNSAVHGGTPGYNDIRKNLVAEIEATGSVTISEIMFDRGNGEYPQWIELYNSSPTNAVNLHSEAGWRLEIRNYDDNQIDFEKVSGTLNFKDSEVQTILPQQTVLIASTRARSTGSDTTNASIVFIPTRVFSVWSEKPARDAIGMVNSRDWILSETAFHLRLIDGKGNEADEAGNLTRRRARGADAYWEWSEVRGDAAMDARSSVIRRYYEYKAGERFSDDDIKDMGVEAEGWVSAADTNFRRVARTWYGHDDDYGTPGTTRGRPLPVSLSKFRPERLKDTGEIVVRWITESELNNAGFNILRSEKRDGEFTKVHFRAGQGTTSERTVYEWKDTSAKPNVVYYYQIQDISLDGEVTTLQVTHLRGNVTAAGKLTTTWGEIKALQ